ncbi:TIGR02186 family protein [Rhizobium sp. C4]|nr:TIGR02186 family protein [Rhizobium sp. C4]MCD2174605.1 TIGR02186 family protein [Rhizobium sp. C4]
MASGARAVEKPGVKVRPPEGIEIGMSTNEIAITSDFTGADLTIFGTLTNVDDYLQQIGQYDIIVTLEGPRVDTTIRRKARVFGIWINTEQMTFSSVPQSYSMTSTRVIKDITTQQELASLNVGIDHIRLFAANYFGDIAALDDFRQAFRRQMLSGGLYQTNPGGIRFVSPSLFRATLKLPADVPNGVHMVHAYLFKSGEFLMETKLPLRVVKTGIEQSLTEAAYGNSFLYGLSAVIIALTIGWAGSVIFRKD